MILKHLIIFHYETVLKASKQLENILIKSIEIISIKTSLVYLSDFIKLNLSDVV